MGFRKACAVALAGVLTLPGGAASAECAPQSFAVAIDVGHHRGAPGATSAWGVSEFTYNLALARKTLAVLTAQGFIGSFIIGESGAAISLAARPGQAAKAQASAFVSIHHDSVQPRYLKRDGTRRVTDHASGFSLFVSRRAGSAGLPLANAIGRALTARRLKPSLHHAEPIPGENRPLLDRSIGLYAYDGLAVLRGTRIPAVLIEAAVIVNPEDERAITSGGLHDRIADAILAGVAQVCR